MKRITSLAETSSWMIPLSRSSNCPRYLVPATTSDRSRARIRLPAIVGGTSPSTIRQASPSTIAVLPTPGSPSSTGLFLRRRERTCTTRSSSISRPISGSNFFSRASFVMSRLNSSRNGVSFFFDDGAAAFPGTSAAWGGGTPRRLARPIASSRAE